MKFSNVCGEFLGTTFHSSLLYARKDDNRLITIFITSQRQIEGRVFEEDKVKRVSIKGLPESNQKPSNAVLQRLFSKYYHVDYKHGEIQVSGKLSGGWMGVNFDGWFEDPEDGFKDLMRFLTVFGGTALLIPSGAPFYVGAAMLCVGILKEVTSEYDFCKASEKLEKIEKRSIDNKEKMKQFDQCLKEELPKLLKHEKVIASTLKNAMSSEKDPEKIKKIATFLSMLYSFKDPKMGKRLGSVGVPIANMFSNASKIRTLAAKSAPLVELVIPGAGFAIAALQALQSISGMGEEDLSDQLTQQLLQMQFNLSKTIVNEHRELFTKVEALLGEEYERLFERIDKAESNVSQLVREANDQLRTLEQNQQQILKRIDEKFKELIQFDYQRMRKEAVYFATTSPSEDQTAEWVGKLMSWIDFSKYRQFTSSGNEDFIAASNSAKSWESTVFGVEWINTYLREFKLSAPTGLPNPLMWTETMTLLIKFRVLTKQHRARFESRNHMNCMWQFAQMGASYQQFVNKLQVSDTVFDDLCNQYLQGIESLEYELEDEETKLNYINFVSILIQAMTHIAFPMSRQQDPHFIALLDRNGQKRERLFMYDDWVKALSGSPEEFQFFIQDAKKGIRLLNGAIRQKTALLKTGNCEDISPAIAATFLQLQGFWKEFYPKEGPLRNLSLKFSPVPMIDVAKLSQGNVFDLARFGCINEVLEQLNRGISVDAVEEITGKTLLHIAVEKGNMNLIEELLRRGAQSIPDRLGKYPIDYTTNPKITSLLSKNLDPYEALGRTKVLKEMWSSEYQNKSSWPRLKISESVVIDIASNPYHIHAYSRSSGKLLFSRSEKSARLDITSLGNTHYLREGTNDRVFQYVVDNEKVTMKTLLKQFSDEIYQIHPELPYINGRCRLWFGTKEQIINKQWNYEALCYDAKEDKVLYRGGSMSFVDTDFLMHVKDNHISLRNLMSNQEVSSIKLPQKPVKLFAKGNFLAVLYDNSYEVYSFETAKKIFSAKFTNTSHLTAIQLGFSMEGRYLIGPRALTKTHSEFEVFDVENQKSIYIFKSSTSCKGDFQIVNKKALIFTVSSTEVIDLSTGQAIQIGQGRKLQQASLIGKTVVSYDQYTETNCFLMFWDAQTGKLNYSFPLQSIFLEISPYGIASQDKMTRKVKFYEPVDLK